MGQDRDLGGRLRRILLGASALTAMPVTALAEDGLDAAMGPLEGLTLLLMTGLSIGAVGALIALARARGDAARSSEAADKALRSASDRALRLAGILDAVDAVALVFPAGKGRPDIHGDLSAVASLPRDRNEITRFRHWLAAEDAAALEGALAGLRSNGEPFHLDLKKADGGYLNAFGRAIGRETVVWLRDLSGERARLAETESRLRKLEDEAAALTTLIDALDVPVWRRGETGQLVQVNAAYARAVEVASPQEAIAAQSELLEAPQRASAAAHRLEGDVYRARVPVIFAGRRRACDIIDAASPGGSIGMALDAEETAQMEARARSADEAMDRTLDALSAAAIVFDSDRTLRYANAGFRKTFQIEPGKLSSRPDSGALLADLRARRQVPEDCDFSKLREEFRAVFTDGTPYDAKWRLPDGRTLTVRGRGHARGGATFIFDNETQRVSLASQVNALLKDQRDTLDGLREGVAVFGADGKLKLSNAAFAALWALAPGVLEPGTHVGKILEACQTSLVTAEALRPLRGFIGSLTGGRTGFVNRLELKDRRVIDLNALPLVDGATLVSFHDVTDTVRAAENLKASNLRLEEANQIKTNFIQHVSYELRSPLTSVIGFADMIAAGETDNLSERQRDYLDHIRTAGASLMALVNSILDLASIDAGVLALNLAETEISRLIFDAIEGLRDRLEDKDISIDIDVPGRLGSAMVDPQRLRQAVYNLVANAVHSSEVGSTVKVRVRGREDALSISVIDRGIGMTQSELDRVLDPFETASDRNVRQGPGLGLTLAQKFVRLHGGNLRLWSRKGFGTVARMTLPIETHVG
ncbi:MAG: PAS-domain containing protein [Hyphomicrobiaceae bacterium]|nr:PAS-domain containing protein [Hyphomicrobiaceae bacterium]